MSRYPLLCTLLLAVMIGPVLALSQQLLYNQKLLRNNASRTIAPEMVLVNDSTLLVFVRNSGLFYIHLQTGNSEKSALEEAGTQAYVYLDYFDDEIVAWMSNIDFQLFRISSHNEYNRIELPIGMSNLRMSVNMSTDGVLCLPRADNPDSTYFFYSRDAGRTWKKQHRLNGASVFAFGNTIMSTDQTSGYYHILELEDAPRWAILPIPVNSHPVLGVASSFRIVGQDQIAWLYRSGTNSELRIGTIGDTVSVAVTSIMIDGSMRELNPWHIYSLHDKRLLYLDRSGWFAIYNGTTWEKCSFHLNNEVGGSRVEVVQCRNWTYLAGHTRFRSVLYRISLESTPKLDSFWMPPGLPSSSLDRIERASLLGSGFLIHHTATSNLFASFTDSVVYVFGSLIRSNPDMPWSRMMYATFTPEGSLRLIDEDGIYIGTDKYNRGTVIRGTVFGADGLQIGPNNVLSFQDRSYREWGLSAPAHVAGGLVFAGPVVRRISLSGDSTDTLYNAPNSFATVLADGRLATGWKNVLRVHGDHATDTTVVSIPSGEVADSMGYPTSMVQCTDGSMVASFQGTWRKDTSEQGMRLYRWGGILRSTDGGTSWQPSTLPDEQANYIQQIHRTATGTLIATAMRMVEDTSVQDVQNVQTEYAANSLTILRSTDCGRTWTEAHRPFYNGPWKMNFGNIIESRDGRLYAALIPGIFTSTNDGQTWEVDERISRTIIPSSITLNTDGTLLLAASDGVYKLDALTNVEEEHTGQRTTRTPMMSMSSDALRSRLTTGTVENATATDLQGREIVLVSNGVLQENMREILPNAVYGIEINGKRCLVLIVPE